MYHRRLYFSYYPVPAKNRPSQSFWREICKHCDVTADIISFDWTIRMGNHLNSCLGFPLNNRYQNFLPSEVEPHAGSLFLNVVCHKSRSTEVKTQKPCKDNGIILESSDKNKIVPKFEAISDVSSTESLIFFFRLFSFSAFCLKYLRVKLIISMKNEKPGTLTGYQGPYYRQKTPFLPLSTFPGY